jgi:hypothetical protein
LKSANPEGFELEVLTKEKVDGTKIPVAKSLVYTFEQIKTVNLVISFK